MLDHKDQLLSEPTTTDFTQFLSARLRLEPPDTLAVLGSFLLTFEPSRSYVRRNATNFQRGE